MMRRKVKAGVAAGVGTMLCVLLVSITGFSVGITVDGGSHYFEWTGAGPVWTDGPYTFTSTGPVILEVRDCCLVGDRFGVYDNGSFLGNTSSPGPGLSEGQWTLPAGSHSITLQVIENPYEYGGGYIEAFTPPDTTPPTDPTLSSPTHTVGVWSDVSLVEVEWSGASDGGGSGVAGYSTLWDTSPGSVPDQTIDVPHGSDPHSTSAALADGDSHWFHLRTVDVAGNWTSTVHFGPITIDTMPPTIHGCPGDIEVDAAPGAPDAQVWWTEPTATDNLSGVASFTCTHTNGDRFPLGITLVTYVATDGAGNVSTCSFLIIVHETLDLVAPLATGQYLDRIEADPYEPVIGELPVYAVYEVGEPIESCCMVINWMEIPLEASDTTMGLYSVEIGEDFDVRELLDSQLLTCDPETLTYCLTIPTEELEPGYYDIRLGLPFHDHQWLRVELVAPAP
jgi:hypothetical protein